jgi:hypothetical protein
VKCYEPHRFDILHRPIRKDRRNKFDIDKCQDIKQWVSAAITGEDRKPKEALWRNAPSAGDAFNERFKQISFLRKHAKTEPQADRIADRLEACEVDTRCCSGACPECCRLFQRWFVRASKEFISRHIDQPGRELVALNMVPTKPVVRRGKLDQFSMVDMQRRMKFALNKTDLVTAIGAVDFSFNEDKDERYRPYWCPHIYLITATENRAKLGHDLRKLNRPSVRVPHPNRVIPAFENTAYRRSYAFKTTFDCRIGYMAEKIKSDGTVRTCRNTYYNRLRANERLELFIFLDQIGLAARVIFYGAKPVINDSGVSINAVGGRRITRSERSGKR